MVPLELGVNYSAFQGKTIFFLATIIRKKTLRLTLTKFSQHFQTFNIFLNFPFLETFRALIFPAVDSLYRAVAS